MVLPPYPTWPEINCTNFSNYSTYTIKISIKKCILFIYLFYNNNINSDYYRRELKLAEEEGNGDWALWVSLATISIHKGVAKDH